MWNPKEDPQWRTRCTPDDRDALILAGWFDEGDELDERLQKAIELQDMLRLRGFTYDELEEEFEFEELDFLTVYDTLCWAFADTVRAGGDLLARLTFDEVSHIATRYARNALEGLARLGIIDIPDDGLSQLPGWDQTRGTPHPQSEAAPELLGAIYEWAQVMLEQDMRERGDLPPHP